MRIAILETGGPPEVLKPQFGDYGDMFERLLKGAGLSFERASFDVTALDFPGSPADFDAHLITGSAAGVYDPLPWIGPLKDYLVAARGRSRLVGVCFGHQIMAEAFGGRAIKSPKGWGLGLQTYRITDRRPWMNEGRSVALPVSHQDQVVALPPGAKVVGGNAFCEFGVLAYEDQPAISMQPHPEFHPAYASALIERRLETVLDEAQGRAAIESLKATNDRQKVGGWIARFLRNC